TSFSALSFNAFREIAPEDVSGSDSVINSGIALATIGRMLPGTAQVTNPAPIRKAAIEAMVGAPDFPREPPIINAWPYRPLLEFRRRCSVRIAGGSFHSIPK